jgi:hypothetical protein
MKKTAVYNCVTRLSEGRASATDAGGSGRPATSRTEENIAKVRQIKREKSSAVCQEHSRASELRQRNKKILTGDLDMRKVCAKMVPKEAAEEQKNYIFFI